MFHLRHRLKIFYLFSRYSSFCIFNCPMIYQIWDRKHFWIYLLNHNSLSHQTWPIDRYKQEQQFSGIFWTIWATGAKFQVLFNGATCSNYSITNNVNISVIPWFQGESRAIKTGKCQLLKTTWSCYTISFIKLWNDLEQVSSHQHWAKITSEMFAMQHTSIWPNFILI